MTRVLGGEVVVVVRWGGGGRVSWTRTEPCVRGGGERRRRILQTVAGGTPGAVDVVLVWLCGVRLKWVG